MAAITPNEVLRLGGRLSYGPTTLAPSTGWPWGGTGLGIVSAAALEPNIITEPLVSPERNEAHEVLWLGGTWTFSAVLRQWHDDVNALFPNVDTGAVSGENVITGRGTFRPGGLLSSKAVVLLWTPDDPAQPFLVFHRAVPLIAPAARLNLSSQSAFSFATVWLAIADGSDETIDIGAKADIASILGIANS